MRERVCPNPSHLPGSTTGVGACLPTQALAVLTANRWRSQDLKVEGRRWSGDGILQWSLGAVPMVVHGSLSEDSKALISFIFMVACICHLIFSATTQYFFKKILCCGGKNKVADTCHHIDHGGIIITP